MNKFKLSKLDWIDKLILWIFYAAMVGAIIAFLTYKTINNMVYSKYENEIVTKKIQIIELCKTNEILQEKMSKMQKIIDEYKLRYGRVYGFKYPNEPGF